MIVPNIILIWTGTNASIPSGFTRETILDGRYPKATAVSINPNVNGGATTHTHTSPSHTHEVNPHTHTYSTDENLGSSSTATTDNSGILAGEHSHTGTSGALSGGTSSAVSVTYGAWSNDPPYYGVIYIKSTGYNFIPNSASCFWNTASVPSGFGYHNGVDATPDLRNKYLKGANAGADAGAQTGGSTTNEHDISHGHTANSHTHVGATSSLPVGSFFRYSETSSGTQGMVNHAHTVTLTGGTEPIDYVSGSLIATAETVEPAYKKVLAIKNTSGAARLPKGVIAMWLGTLASVPVGWNLCDGTKGTPDLRDKYIKVANTTGEIGDTGGSNAHTHSADPHPHGSTGSHTHSGTVSAHVPTRDPTGGGGIFDVASHAHTLTSVSSANPGYADASTTANSSSNEPLYTTVAYIQFEYSLGGAPLAFLM